MVQMPPENFVTMREHECDNPKHIEDLLHETYDNYRYWTFGKVRQTEFFYIACLESVLRWMDTLKELTDVTDRVRAEEEMVDEKISDQNSGETDFIVGRRPDMTFAMVNIPPGSTLSLDIDEKAIIKTADNKNLVEATQT